MKHFSIVLVMLVLTFTSINASSFKVLSIDPNGGNNTMIAHNLIYDIGASFVVTNPTRAGYTFTGWTGTGAKYLGRQNTTGFSASELTFNGTSDYYNLGTSYKYTDKITVNLWAYMDNWAEYAGTPNMRMISCTESGGWNIEVYNTTNVRFIAYDNGGYKHVNTSVAWSSLSSGWHMFTLTFDGRNLYGYIDGALKGASPIFSNKKITYHASNSIILGAEAGDGATAAGNYFKGKIKELSIANAAVTTTDVAALYASTKTNKSENPNTNRYYMADVSASIKASWEANASTTLTIDANGGVNTMAKSTYTQAEGTALTITSPTREGCTFLGWEGTNHRFLSNNQGHKCSSTQEISFNGTSTYFNLGRDYMFTNVLTMNMWAYMSNWSDYATSAMRLISCTQSGGWNIEINGEKIRFAVYDSGKGAYNSIALAKKWSDLTVGWHMFTLVFDGSQAYAYIDGKFEGKSGVFVGRIGYHAENSILVGAEVGTGNTPVGNYFKGKIKNLAIMKTAITPEEVALLYNTPGVTRYYFPEVNKTIKAMWDGVSTEIVSPQLHNLVCTVDHEMLRIEGGEVLKIELYSLVGQRISSAKAQNELSVAGLHGVYLVVLTDTYNNVTTEKIIIN